MPIVDLTMAEGSLEDQKRHELLDRVGRIAIDYEGLSGSKFAESFTWVYLHELPATHVTQVSGTPPKPLYRFVFTTLQTLLDNDSKHRLGEDVARAVYEVENAKWDPKEAHNRVWVFYDDYRQGDWIVGGQINAIKDLRAEVEKERTKAAA